MTTETSGYVDMAQVAWTSTSYYPPELRAVYRYKQLLGPDGRELSGLNTQDVRMGYVELDVGATYPAHYHPAPEIYVVIEGTARWTIDESTFDVQPGTAIYHAPNAHHAMTNLGPQPLRLIYFWWAPGGQQDILFVGSQLVEP